MSTYMEKASASTSTHYSIWDWVNCFLPTFFLKNDSNEIDCKIHENALKILGLSEKEAEDRRVLDQRYQSLCEEWSIRVEKSSISEPLEKEFKKLLNRTNNSYSTLIENLHSNKKQKDIS